MATETPTTLTVGTVAPKGGKQFQGLFNVIPFTFNFEEDSIAAGVASSGTIAVAGAEIGDLVLVSMAQAPGELIAYGSVTAADTVRVGAFNVDTGGASTVLATVGKGKGVVLKFKDNVFAEL